MDVGFYWFVPVEPWEAPPPEGWAPPMALPSPGAPAVAPEWEEPFWEEPDAGPAAAEPAPAKGPLAVAAPAPLKVGERGFFSGDQLRLEALLLDPASGEVLWVKRLATKDDPRDAAAVKRAVDQLLAPGDWQAPAPAGN